MMTDTQREALAQTVDDLNDRIATHSDAALDALESIEAHDSDTYATLENHRVADIELRRAQLHAGLALGLRVDILTQLVTAAALPGYFGDRADDRAEAE